MSVEFVYSSREEWKEENVEAVRILQLDFVCLNKEKKKSLQMKFFFLFFLFSLFFSLATKAKESSSA